MLKSINNTIYNKDFTVSYQVKSILSMSKMKLLIILVLIFCHFICHMSCNQFGPGVSPCKLLNEYILKLYLLST